MTAGETDSTEKKQENVFTDRRQDRVLGCTNIFSRVVFIRYSTWLFVPLLSGGEDTFSWFLSSTVFSASLSRTHTHTHAYTPPMHTCIHSRHIPLPPTPPHTHRHAHMHIMCTHATHTLKNAVNTFCVEFQCCSSIDNEWEWRTERWGRGGEEPVHEANYLGANNQGMNSPRANSSLSKWSESWEWEFSQNITR